MKILDPIEKLDDWLKSFPKKSRESGQPQNLNDESEDLARMLGRQRVTYEPVWQAVEAAPPRHWVPVLCNSYRRALLLASSAMQHRTKAYNVWRRGRIVCIQAVEQTENKEASAVQERASA